MTEDEAKKTRCCGPVGCGGNEFDALSGTTGRHCIGSACMAWRSEQSIKTNKYGENEEYVDTGHGFCGLASRP